MLEGGGVSFAVVFFDGENTIDVGEVMVDSALNFKSFQSDLSQRIGISPHQLSVYFARPESNRKIPITSKVNFAAIARERSGFFFVKRSRRPRRHKTHKEERDSSRKVDQGNKNPPANVMILRRNSAIDNFPPIPGFAVPILDRIGYQNRVRNVNVQRERFMMNMRFGSLCLDRDLDGGESNLNGGELVCEVCSIANGTGRDVGFHWCVHDAVTSEFRSPAGPISRPKKNSGGS